MAAGRMGDFINRLPFVLRPDFDGGRPLAAGMEIILENLGVVEDERPRQVVPREYADRPGVGRGPRAAGRPGDKHGGYVMPARVARRVGIAVKLAEQLHVQGGFLPGFADGGRFQGLSIIDIPARQGPAVGRVATLDQNDPRLLEFYDNIDCRDGVFVSHDSRVFGATCGARG